MRVILEKNLSVSERERHWVTIPAASRNHFPAHDIVFRIKIGNFRATTYIDRYNRLRLGARLFDKIDLEELGYLVVIKKNPEGMYFVGKKRI